MTGWSSRYACLLSLLAAIPAHAQTSSVIYVDAGAGGENDGTSWTHAYIDLQDALDETALSGRCTADSPCEVWIVAGTYSPDRGTGDRFATFDLVNHAGIYGGFAGWETSREERDWMENETILSGDLGGNDDLDFLPESDCCTAYLQVGCDNQACYEAVSAFDPSCVNTWSRWCTEWAQELCCGLCRPSRCDNAHNVVTAIDVGPGIALDGLTIADGETKTTQGPSAGGGLFAEFAEPSTPRIANCVFRDNAGEYASAAHLGFASPEISNCRFVNNVGFSRGGSTVRSGGYNGELALTDCVFAGTESPLDSGPEVWYVLGFRGP